MTEGALFTASSDVVTLRTGAECVCKLCLTECSVAEMFTLQDCHCSFCFLCMQQYVAFMVKEGNVMDISCPDGQCWTIGQLQTKEIEKLVDASVFDRYKRIHFLREVDCDPCRTFCPKPGCETVCYVCVGNCNGATPPRPIKCQTCTFVFCCVCKNQWHPAKTCDQAMGDSGLNSEGGIPFQSPEESQIKRCPVCHIPIERNDGCAQMMCKHCKHVFCWYCLASLDDDFMLRHYDKGPCRNKLGHSRASVVWHRTQVVGIFAGFGILLLVASPFLLLAAPCILFCKCKACKCCDDDIDPGETITSS